MEIENNELCSTRCTVFESWCVSVCIYVTVCVSLCDRDCVYVGVCVCVCMLLTSAPFSWLLHASLGSVLIGPSFSLFSVLYFGRLMQL